MRDKYVDSTSTSSCPVTSLFFKTTACITTLVLAFLLSACDSSDNQPQNDPARLDATLIAPTVQATSTEVCTDIPTGYSPLVRVEVNFLDSQGNIVSLVPIMTDECGHLSAEIPGGAQTISAISDDNKKLVASLQSIVASGGIASTIPKDAEYSVGFLTSLDDNSLGFTITDTITKKAVVGLPIDSFSIILDDTSASFTSLSNRATSSNASIVMVTDASPSMDRLAFLDPETDIRYSRLNLSAIAAHQFLDQKEPEDEAGMVIFDSTTDFMDNQRINELFDLADENGEPTTYDFSENGFSDKADDFRLIVDAYNSDSKIWNPDNQFNVHPQTPSVTITSNYPWTGGTAYYDGTILASERLITRSNPRKIIITMSDGGNNRGSVRNINTVISTANENSTPVYTIGFESSRETDLQRLATETGATYFKAESLEISDAYASIQSGIVFQYTGKLLDSLSGKNTIVLELDIEGDGIVEASRTLVN